ncbi:hypothetical protein O53_5213 [Microcystis aeruginosa TAIHU98]|uniref:Uncharacterized protein n=1 Tax=Microcystis aeruginosa TAIHU98 TaxID=1134457 RepID=L7E0W0_MICAE|nr:hypothetical protein O53_5213 [Microcystis aeruginosa TAIHU98]
MAIEFIRILLGSIVAIEGRPFREFFFNWQLPRIGPINLKISKSAGFCSNRGRKLGTFSLKIR